MQATIIDGVLLLAIIAAIVVFYFTAYGTGVKDGTDTGYAAGFSAGKSAGVAESGVHLRACYQDAEQIKQLREIERREHQAALESIMLDCDERIAIYARRATLLSHHDLNVLLSAARKLSLAADTFAGMRADDHAQAARSIALNTLNIAERLRTHLEAAATPATEKAEAA